MSQIDKVAFLPLLFWFWLLFLVFYGFMFSYVVTYFYLIFRTRNYYIDELVTFSYIVTILLILFLFSALI